MCSKVESGNVVMDTKLFTKCIWRNHTASSWLQVGGGAVKKQEVRCSPSDLQVLL